MTYKIPEGRTEEYWIWRACERFKIKPPGIKDNWNDIDYWTQIMMIEFERGREYEDVPHDLSCS